MSRQRTVVPCMGFVCLRLGDRLGYRSGAGVCIAHQCGPVPRPATALSLFQPFEAFIPVLHAGFTEISMLQLHVEEEPQ